MIYASEYYNTFIYCCWLGWVGNQTFSIPLTFPFAQEKLQPSILFSFPGGTNEALLQKFNSIHNNTKFYEKPQRKEGAFIIRHYAGKVKYQVSVKGNKSMQRKHSNHILHRFTICEKRIWIWWGRILWVFWRIPVCHLWESWWERIQWLFFDGRLYELSFVVTLLFGMQESNTGKSAPTTPSTSIPATNVLVAVVIVIWS